ncbi:MAG: hypothetical protein IKT28_05160 [Rikenellaceae bacterium]|nr:hypothetical protein [Rikenellaceae bacterium]MBR6496477.1 hypothetical protein [Rikenellaceae bacterium]
MKKLLKLAIASIMVIGATTFVSAQTDKKTFTQKHIERCTEEYEKLSLINEDGTRQSGRTSVERSIIRKGESTRYKHIFEPDHIKRFIIEGVGETTDKDIRNGKFEVTLKPEKTTTYKIITEFPGGNRIDHDITIVVVDAEVYDSIIELRSKMNSQQRALHYDELCGKKVDPYIKAEIDKMAKMTPKERAAYKRKLERGSGKIRRY